MAPVPSLKFGLQFKAVFRIGYKCEETRMPFSFYNNDFSHWETNYALPLK
jgi:hypothetical protein